MQAWLLEKPAVWAEEDVASLAAALMAQRPPARAREDALLQAERLYYRLRIEYLEEDLTLSVEGVSQMVYILPERLPALVRPAFDLVLRRIRSLKRCAQA